MPTYGQNFFLVLLRKSDNFSKSDKLRLQIITSGNLRAVVGAAGYYSQRNRMIVVQSGALLKLE